MQPPGQTMATTTLPLLPPQTDPAQQPPIPTQTGSRLSRRSMMTFQQWPLQPAVSAPSEGSAAGDIVALRALGVSSGLPLALPPAHASRPTSGGSGGDVPRWQQTQHEAERQLGRIETWWNQRPKVTSGEAQQRVMAASGPPEPGGPALALGQPGTSGDDNPGNMEVVDSGSSVEISPNTQDSGENNKLLAPAAPGFTGLQQPSMDPPSMDLSALSATSVPNQLPPHKSLNPADIQQFLQFQELLQNQKLEPPPLYYNSNEGPLTNAGQQGSVPPLQSVPPQSDLHSTQPSVAASSGPLWEAAMDHFHPQPASAPPMSAAPGNLKSSCGHD